MSSWGSGKVHFRERKLPNQQNILQPNIVQTKQIETNISTAPSRWVIPKYTTVICTIALNEEKYIDEWIKYHIALGFQHIYIYDNSTDYILKSKESSFVTVIHFPGPEKQLQAYDIFVTTYKNKHKWAAFIDCDEFIVLKKHKNIINFLNDYNDCECVGLNWLFFGTSNEKYYRNEPVTKRFTLCSNEIDPHIKSICQINKIYKYTLPHLPLLTEGNVYNTAKEIVNQHFNHSKNCDVAVLHHYYTKSEEELNEKINRPRPDSHLKRANNFEWLLTQYNDVKNTDAWDFYSKHLPS